MKRVVVIGAGPGGICAGKRLKDAGCDDFVILERAPRVGGTWWHNAYPGCRCDVPSHLYSFSFAIKPDWSCPYAGQAEIQAYLEDCVERFGLRPHLLSMPTCFRRSGSNGPPRGSSAPRRGTSRRTS